MDPRIAALLEALGNEDARAEELAGLTDEQLAEVEADLKAAGRELRGDGDPAEITAEVEADLGRVVAAVQVIRQEAADRIAAAEVAAQEAVERAERAAALAAELEDPEPDAEPDEPDPEPDEQEIEAAVEVPAKRRGPSLADMAARRPASAEPQPAVVTDVRPRWLLEGGKAQTTSMRELAERMAEAANSFLSAPPGFKDRVKVASLKVDYPEDRLIGLNDDVVDAHVKIQALTAAARHADYTEEQEALVASGGFCAPSEPRYDIFSVVTADRPVRAGLANIGVSRGALTYVRGGRMSDIDVSGSGAAVTVWPESTDITPGETTKTAQTFTCRTVQDTTLAAVVAQVQFGNFMNRAFPELVQDDLNEVMAAHARIAERMLLDNLITAINTDITQTGHFGTARDIKQVLMQMLAQLRSVERSNTPCRAIIERTILQMVQQDLLFQTASGELQAVMETEADAAALIRSSGVNVTYALDTSTGADVIVTNSDGENLADYPDNFEIPFFYEGSVAFLDGGTLDLGIVRDSTLNDTNDYMVFMETFENVAWFGPHALTLTLTTCPNGDSQLPAAVTDICSGS